MKLKILVMVLIIVPVLYGWCEKTFFRSNVIGMMLEQIPWYKTDDYDFIIEREKAKEADIRKLLEKGKLIKRFETRYDEKEKVYVEREYGPEKLVELAIYDKDHYLVEEESFDKDQKLVTRSLYNYRADRFLESIDVYDSAGILLYTDFYSLSSTGRLRDVKRTAPDGTVQGANIIAGGGKLAQESLEKTGENILSRFDDKGRIFSWEKLKDNKVLLRRIITYNEQTSKIAAIAEENLSDNKVYLNYFDEDGNIKTEIVKQGELILESYENKFDKSNNKIESRKKGSKGIELWVYDYSSGKTLVSETYYFRGTLASKTVYLEDMLYEELYKDDQPFIRIYYKNDKKIKEEIIMDGKVVKTREFNE